MIEIKIGMHKKAVSLMGGATTQILPLNDQPHHFYEYTKNPIESGGNSMKQSYLPSWQTSFNEYSSAHGNNYGDAKMFPKVDNFLLNTDKTGSLLTQ
jgi:hypothetical protein